MKDIPSAGPWVTEEEVGLVAEAVKEGWYEKRNMHIDKFIEEFSDYCKCKYALPVCNATSALHLAMISLGIKPGDEVIVPDLTWVASAAPIHYLGATPVFVDVNKDNWCMSVSSMEAAITNKTKAIVAVDLLGNMADMDEINKIASERQIPVIEDAAESSGGHYKGKVAGTLGDIGVYSFNATKLFISGQGGLLVTDNKEYYEIAKLFMHHGIDQSREGKYYWSYEVGYNYQWTNIQAALALGQFRRLSELLEKKRQVYSWYKDGLNELDNISLNKEQDGNTYWIVSAIIGKEYGMEKEAIMKSMKQQGIDVRPFFYPLSSMPAYEKYCQGKMDEKNPVSYEISPYGICLPSAMTITKEDVNRVCETLLRILK